MARSPGSIEVAAPAATCTPTLASAAAAPTVPRTAPPAPTVPDLEPHPDRVLDTDFAIDFGVDGEADDDPADDQVHHHARIDADGALAGTDTIRTLCGLRLPRPRPDAARMPCCPRCAAVMGGRCR